MTVRLYAVLRPLRRAPACLPPGIDAEPLRLVKCGRVFAAISDVDRPLASDAGALRAFDRVVRALEADSAAILPARFGTLSLSQAAVIAELSGRSAVLRVALDRVAGAVQMTVRIDAASGRPRQSAVRTIAGRGTAYLRGLAAAAAPPELIPLRGAVGGMVRAERVEGTSEGTTVYHLIARSDVAAYLARAERVSGLRTAGPFPPYAFAAGIDHAIAGTHEKRKPSSRAGSTRSGARRRSS